jgi:hypothetical protein
MPSDAFLILRLLHILIAVFMAWPYYALVVVNQRVALGTPFGSPADLLMENIIRNRTVPCFIFQASALLTGLGLILGRGLGLGALISVPMLGLKFLLLLVIAGLLSYVHFAVQPAINRLLTASAPPSEEDKALISRLRARRKKIASLCLFIVLVIIILGVQVWTPLPPWLGLLLVLAAGLFTHRAANSPMRFGWL